jgi:hypothetical protein
MARVWRGSPRWLPVGWHGARISASMWGAVRLLAEVVASVRIDSRCRRPGSVAGLTPDPALTWSVLAGYPRPLPATA